MPVQFYSEVHQFNLAYLQKLADCGVCAEDAENHFKALNKKTDEIREKLSKQAAECPEYPVELMRFLLKVSEFPELADEVDDTMTKEADLSDIVDKIKGYAGEGGAWAQNKLQGLQEKYPWLDNNTLAMGAGGLSALLGPVLFPRNPLLGALFTGGAGLVGGKYLPQILEWLKQRSGQGAISSPVTASVQSAIPSEAQIQNINTQAAQPPAPVTPSTPLAPNTGGHLPPQPNPVADVTDQVGKAVQPGISNMTSTVQQDARVASTAPLANTSQNIGQPNPAHANSYMRTPYQAPTLRSQTQGAADSVRNYVRNTMGEYRAGQTAANASRGPAPIQNLVPSFVGNAVNNLQNRVINSTGGQKLKLNELKGGIPGYPQIAHNY